LLFNIEEIFSSISRFPSSLPKQISSTKPRESRSATEPRAKVSALAHEKTTGNSKTRSAPQSIAIFARRYLSVHATPPRWTKLPLITTTTLSAPSCFFVCSIWYLCPLWNGLYSATIPIVFNVNRSFLSDVL